MSNNRKEAHRPESELVVQVANFLIDEGYRIRTEVPSLGQSADVVATRGRWVTFIEVKVRDWRRAFKQCQAHRLVADYICIALGTKQVSATALDIARDSGVGLIHVLPDGRCEWVSKPVLNDSIWQPQRKQLSQVLRIVQYAN